jgi:hypothetical protein
VKVSIERVLAVIGHEVATKMTSGRYGDTTLTSGGYLRGDPCYWMKGEGERDEFRKAVIEQEAAAYDGTYRNWTEIELRGQPAFVRSCSDGTGPFGHCVDSGWVCAIKGHFTPDGAAWDAPLVLAEV